MVEVTLGIAPDRLWMELILGWIFIVWGGNKCSRYKDEIVLEFVCALYNVIGYYLTS